MASTFKGSPSKSNNDKMKYIIFIFFVLAVSCKRDNAISPDQDGMAGLSVKNSIYTKWKLLGFETGERIAYEVVLEFKTEKNEKGSNILSGKSSINFYQADFSLNNNKITINNLTMTEIAGNTKAMALEKEYFKRLSEVTNFSIANEMLTLSSGKQNMTFQIIN